MNVGAKVEHTVTGRSGKVLEVDARNRAARVLFSSYQEAWVPVDMLRDLSAPAASATKVAACIVCCEPNEYQEGPFTCGKCRHEASLRDDAPTTQPAAAPTTQFRVIPINFVAGQRVRYAGRFPPLYGYTGIVRAVLNYGQLLEVKWDSSPIHYRLSPEDLEAA